MNTIFANESTGLVYWSHARAEPAAGQRLGAEPCDSFQPLGRLTEGRSGTVKYGSLDEDYGMAARPRLLDVVYKLIHRRAGAMILPKSDAVTFISHIAQTERPRISQAVGSATIPAPSVRRSNLHRYRDQRTQCEWEPAYCLSSRCCLSSRRMLTQGVKR
ncbi:hypothetical protein GY45DRAFT_1321315 [Cubamyces sp. BRFM 1775]|nr:hypothetical protein GY45DRAFT_1321315 [Cubamyces sp. BRFM 1775]